jgi:hypothetical protein
MSRTVGEEHRLSHYVKTCPIVTSVKGSPLLQSFMPSIFTSELSKLLILPQVGVGGARNFFEQKAEQQSRTNRFEEEIKAEQEQKKREAEEARKRKEVRGCGTGCAGFGVRVGRSHHARRSK